MEPKSAVQQASRRSRSWVIPWRTSGSSSSSPVPSRPPPSMKHLPAAHSISENKKCRPSGSGSIARIYAIKHLVPRHGILWDSLFPTVLSTMHREHGRVPGAATNLSSIASTRRGTQRRQGLSASEHRRRRSPRQARGNQRVVHVWENPPHTRQPITASHPRRAPNDFRPTPTRPTRNGTPSLLLPLPTSASSRALSGCPMLMYTALRLLRKTGSEPSSSIASV